MKIRNIQINQYGKLKDKRFDLNNSINIIYGRNEAGKSTTLSFIQSMLYGISKNKNGKEISDFERYTPWDGESFSGKLEYELDNHKTFEIIRDFKKKNPKILDENKNDISKEFSIDKTKGTQFFYDQTKIDEDLFLSTVLIEQNKVKLDEKSRTSLIQKIINIVGTGENNVSYKKAEEKLNKKQLNEIGTDRSKEKPINIIEQKLRDLKDEKGILEQYKIEEYEIEEKRNNLNDEIKEIENENNALKELKGIEDTTKIENERIRVSENIVYDNNDKITEIEEKIEENENKRSKVEEKLRRIIDSKNRVYKISIMFLLLIVLVNIIQFVLLKNTTINIAIIIGTIALLALYYFLNIKKIRNKEKIINDDEVNLKNDSYNLNNELELLRNNNNSLNDEINKIKASYNLKLNLEKEKIKNKYKNTIDENKLREIIEIKNIETRKNEIQDLLNRKTLELHALDLDYRNIEPRLENLSTVEEEIVDNESRKKDLKDLEKSIEIAKEVLTESYSEMRRNISPKIINNLSNIIKEITNGKYNNVVYKDNEGLVVEIENGDYVSCERLSIGTIDQLYLSLRMSMIEEMSYEKMPIILDETFAYYDKERLEKVLLFLKENFNNHQIIIFTCTNREKEILDENCINYNFINL